MREFILLARKARTTPDFSLNNLPESGRMDLVCRTIANAFFIANNLRKDTMLSIIMYGPKSPPKCITFNGAELEIRKPDELSIAREMQKALKKGLPLRSYEEKEVAPGIIISKKSFESFVKERKNVQLIYLDKKGKDIRECNIKDDSLFILGDFIGLPKKTEKLLKSLNAEKISLGPLKIFSSQCVTLIHNELDRKLK